MTRSSTRQIHTEEEESYFVSMADMMVGLLFVFIILLMYFALQFQQKSAQWESAAKTRQEILSAIVREIKKENPQLEVDREDATGVLHVNADVLFTQGNYAISQQGQTAIGAVAHAMAKVLPCYTRNPRPSCSPVRNTVEALFIEGHTDAAPMRGAGPVQDNMDLSALRATNTFRAMQSAAPDLRLLQNESQEQILSVSGYGDQRLLPRKAGESEVAYMARNRRIDFRILMDTPIDEKTRMMLGTKP
jgi:flagellar motor protein MotB